MKSTRIIEANGQKFEIVGACNKCMIFVGDSQPSGFYRMTFKSLVAARRYIRSYIERHAA